MGTCPLQLVTKRLSCLLANCVRKSLYSTVSTLLYTFTLSYLSWTTLSISVLYAADLLVCSMLAQMVMLCLMSNFCNLHPVVSSFLFICSLIIRFAMTVIFEPFAVPGLRARVPVCSYCQRSFKTPTFVALRPRTNGWQFSQKFSPNAGNIESYACVSLRTPLKSIREYRWS